LAALPTGIIELSFLCVLSVLLIILMSIDSHNYKVRVCVYYVPFKCYSSLEFFCDSLTLVYKRLLFLGYKYAMHDADFSVQLSPLKNTCVMQFKCGSVCLFLEVAGLLSSSSWANYLSNNRKGLLAVWRPLSLTYDSAYLGRGSCIRSYCLTIQV
jgi:hypothetical protein